LDVVVDAIEDSPDRSLSSERKDPQEAQDSQEKRPISCASCSSCGSFPLNHRYCPRLPAAGAGGLMRASSQCSLIRPFSIRTTSKWFHLYSRLASSGSFAVRSHIITEYGPSMSVNTGAFTHSGLISRGVRPGVRLMNCLKP